MIERTILNSLIQNEDYVRKAIPYLKEEYFHDLADKTVYNIICEYFDKYNKPPTVEAISVELSNKNNLSEQQYTAATELVKGFEENDNDEDWLLDETEKFCQDKAVYNAIMESISIIDGKTDKGRGALPTILSDALSVSFDPHIGHDFIDDAEQRWEFYHTEEVKVRVCLCVTVQLLILEIRRMCCISHWRWLKKELLNVLMPI